MATTSPYIRQALDRVKELRFAHRDHRAWEFQQAEEATKGAMLNARGKAARVDPEAMLDHNMVYIRAYGSPELLEHLAEHPLLRFSEWERMFFAPDQEF